MWTVLRLLKASKPSSGLVVPGRVMPREIAMCLALDGPILFLYDAMSNRQHHDVHLVRTVEEEPYRDEMRQQ